MMIYNDILPIDCGSVNVKQVLSKLIKEIKDFILNKYIKFNKINIEIIEETDEWNEIYPHVAIFISYTIKNTITKIFINIYTNKVQMMQKTNSDSIHIDLIFEKNKDYNFPDFNWLKQQFADLVKR